MNPAMIATARYDIQKEVAKIPIPSDHDWACPKCRKPRFAYRRTRLTYSDKWNRRICECGCVWCGVCEKELVVGDDGLWNVFAHFGDEGCPMTMKASTLAEMSKERIHIKTKSRLLEILKEYKTKHPECLEWDLSLKELQSMLVIPKQDTLHPTPTSVSSSTSLVPRQPLPLAQKVAARDHPDYQPYFEKLRSGKNANFFIPEMRQKGLNVEALSNPDILV
ncbi:hypothetical protein BLNAU_21043 [Blattamonas nauphoetae]|uniref:Uncharacterized protein n=1 Tax=Blattamonas nauphoetae TaxID=2049346 RepID=A0ABQ9WX17_9EUKA|nr:hypothetical protein BLNAU_21043 [Blattamonas nauphoetae]